MVTLKKIVLSCVLLLITASCAANGKDLSKNDADSSAQAWNEKRVVWFEKPAKEWKVATPVGNGRLGAMVLGTYPKERIQLNEDSIWAKEPMTPSISSRNRP